MAQDLTVRLLGRFAVEVDGAVALDGREARQKPLALLKLLALQPAGALPRSGALLALWPEVPAESAATQLRKNRLYLRRALQESGCTEELVLLRGEQLSLDDRVVVDAHMFRREAERALELRTDLAAFNAALAWHGGDLLPEDAGEPWTSAARTDLRALYHRLLLELASLHESHGRFDESIGAFASVLDSEPLNEQAHRELMRLYVASGRRDLALKQFEICRDSLRQELDVEPEPETLDLHEQIRAGATTLRSGVSRERALVGREPETAVIREAVEDLVRGHGGVMLISGEAGIGKTSLAEALSSYASLRGARVAWGRSYEGDSEQGFAPWIRILQSLTREGARSPARADSQGVTSLLAGRPALETGSAPREAQHRLFAAIVAFLRAVSERRPVVAVFDDIQWADQDSVLLLREAARELRGSRILIVATCRDADPGASPAALELVAELRRESRVRSTDVTGLELHDVALLASTMNVSPGDAGVRMLWERTRGNPLFLIEYLRLMETSGASYDRGDPAGGAMPRGVRDVIKRRLVNLPDDCRAVLGAAAVVGPEFDAPTLSRIVEIPELSILSSLDDAVRARVLVHGDGRVGAFRFEHPLIYQATYDELALDQRVLLHQRAADVLEEACAAGDETHVAQLAHHLLRAAPAPGVPARALSWATRAAERAFGLMAYEEAARLYASALDLASTLEPDIARRGDLHLRLGRAQWAGGHFPEAHASYETALRDGREVGASNVFARAVVWLCGLTQSSWAPSENIVSALDEALAMHDAGDTGLRARLLALRAEKAVGVANADDRRRWSDEAIAMARWLNDPEVLISVLASSHDANSGPDDLEHRLALTAEMQTHARAIGDHSTLGAAHVRRMAALLEAADLPGFDREYAALVALAREYGLPSSSRHALAAQATRSMMRGRWDEAEQFAREALEGGQRVRDPDSPSIFAGQLFQVRWLQGRLSELEPLAPQFLRDNPHFTPWRVALALMYTELDRPAAARAEFEQLAMDEFAVLPRDRFWIVSVNVLAQVCSYLDDARRAAQLYDALRPFAERTGVMSFSQACTGSNHRALGLLSRVAGDLDRAAEHLELALARNESLGAIPWIALTKLDYAKTLTQRNRPDDRARSTSAAAEARAIAHEISMTRCINEADALLQTLGA